MDTASAQALPDNPVALLLRKIGWSPEQLIARINQVRARRGSQPLDIKSAYPWVRPEPSRPNRENRTDALAVLTARAGRPVTSAELGWDTPRRPRRGALNAPCDADTGDLLREITQGDLMDRRNLLLLTGAAATAPALSLLLGPAEAAATSGSTPSAQLVRRIETAVRDLRELDDEDGSTAGLDWAGGLWQSTARIVRSASGETPTTLRLRTAFIELSEQYGWMCFDANRHPQAQRVYHTGMRLAAETGPDPLVRQATSNLLGSSAYQASWLGQHKEAAAILNVATRTARSAGNPPGLTAVLAERAIFAAGRRGDTESLQRACDTAHADLQLAGTGEQSPWWAQWLSHAAIDAGTGRAWLASRVPKAAEPYLTRRVETTSPAFPRDRMLAVLDLADAHHQCGDRDRALQLSQTASALGTAVGSHRAHGRLRTLLGALEA
ncbi:XRE family transcriptional regulator [Streptomyces californicus]|uniref:XRE family transcriptional regulator n=1 Tax=Streptomyces californicus TaxID=67351 RepID=UPI0033E32D17